MHYHHHEEMEAHKTGYDITWLHGFKPKEYPFIDTMILTDPLFCISEPAKKEKRVKMMGEDSAHTFEGEKSKPRPDKQKGPVLITDALSDVREKYVDRL